MASGALNPILKEIVFSDVNVSFKPHPVTGKLPVLKNADAVKRAVRNLILTNYGERPYDMRYGGNVRAMLFEHADDPITQDELALKITSTIEQYEPRANVDKVVVSSKPDSNAIAINIRFMIVNERFPVDLEVAIERVR